jgi:protein gp37
MISARWNHRLPSNVWIGSTICNQPEADRDIPKLLDIEACVHFISVEPLLGSLRIDDIAGPRGVGVMKPLSGIWWKPREGVDGLHYHQVNKIDWVIVGGESGPNARPMHPEWVRNLRNQCNAAGVPFLFKQWGEWEIASVENGHYESCMERNKAHWVFPDGCMQKPSSFRVGWNGGDPIAMVQVGKKAAGRMLDSRLWTEYPNPLPCLEIAS